MNKNIYTLRLHEKSTTNNGSIERVPGGWIYIPYGNPRIPVFVPFHIEFQEEYYE